MLHDLLRRIRAADSQAPPLTPLEYNAALSELVGCEVWLKCEHVLPTGSFKYRGALNKVRALGDSARGGVITASTGNHGQAVAFAGRLAGIDVRVFAPENAAAKKLAAIRALGATVVVTPGAALDAELAARAFADAAGQPYISPYNDLDVMAGHAAIAREIFQQAPHTEAIFVSVGGGGLLGGVGAAAKDIKPDVRMVGCWPENAASLLRALEAGAIHDVEEQATLSDATAGGVEEGALTFPICQAILDHAIRVSEDEIAAAMQLAAQHAHWMIEGAAGVALAGLLKAPPALRGRAAVAVLCGRNIALGAYFAALERAGGIEPPTFSLGSDDNRFSRAVAR